jgi:hypothetical protein
MLEANRVLTEQVQALAQEIQHRSLPRLGEMCDAINAMASNAKRGNAAAKQALQRFYEAFDEGRAACSGLEIAHGTLPMVRKQT